MYSNNLVQQILPRQIQQSLCNSIYFPSLLKPPTLNCRVHNSVPLALYCITWVRITSFPSGLNQFKYHPLISVQVSQLHFSFQTTPTKILYTFLSLKRASCVSRTSHPPSLDLWHFLTFIASSTLDIIFNYMISRQALRRAVGTYLFPALSTALHVRNSSHFLHSKQSTGYDWMDYKINLCSWPAKTLMVVTNDKIAVTPSGKEFLLETEKEPYLTVGVVIAIEEGLHIGC